jgi:hypothetical protein
MLCNEKYAHKVEISENQRCYVFYFRVSDFTPKVQRIYKQHNSDDVEVCLVRNPVTEGEYKIYKIFVKGYETRAKKLVDMYDLEKPYLLSYIIAGLLEKLQKVC